MTAAALDIRFTCEACPVQAEGTIDGAPFYFRARGQHWEIEIAGGPVLEFMGRGPAEGWWDGEAWGDTRFAAGWMEHDEARRLIAEAAGRWIAAGRPGVAVN